MNVVVTGGGTGGHIFPALAVAEALRAQGHAVRYIGKTGGMEADLAQAAGFDFAGIDFFGMPRRPGLKLLQWFFALHRARKAARRYLEETAPACVLGTGGYVSAPVLMAARDLGIPYVIHEPDAHPGMANRLMARHADAVTAAFEASRAHFKLPPGTVFQVTGNPVRGDIGRLSKAEAIAALNQRLGFSWQADKPVVLVFGGSQGARRINQALVGALPQLVARHHCQAVHLSGRGLFDETRNQWAQTAPEWLTAPAYRLLPFCEEMPLLLAAADLAVCRSGSLTLSETYLAGLPTLLVPYPFAAANHQAKNAQASAQAGASAILDDDRCTPETLFAEVDRLLGSPETLAAMADAARGLARPEATAEIARLLAAASAR